MSSKAAAGWPVVDHQFGRRFIVPMDHPYVRHFKAEVSDLKGKWRVSWRDFQAVKQEVEFPSLQQALRFATLLQIGPHYANDDGDDLDNCDKFWREMYQK